MLVRTAGLLTAVAGPEHDDGAASGFAPQLLKGLSAG